VLHPVSQATAQPYTHLTADFLGVPAAKCGDQSLVSGLVIAAAGAVGLNPEGRQWCGRCLTVSSPGC
jgi:hypothetical protein